MISVDLGKHLKFLVLERRVNYSRRHKDRPLKIAYGFLEPLAHSSSSSISLPGVISTNPKLGEFATGKRASGAPIASSHALIVVRIV
jgi:hypothetical protein